MCSILHQILCCGRIIESNPSISTCITSVFSNNLPSPGLVNLHQPPEIRIFFCRAYENPFMRPHLLLMVQKSQTTSLHIFETKENHGISTTVPSTGGVYRISGCHQQYLNPDFLAAGYAPLTAWQGKEGRTLAKVNGQRGGKLLRVFQPARENGMDGNGEFSNQPFPMLKNCIKSSNW